MNPLRIILSITLFVTAAASAHARGIAATSYEELLEKSDLVVIAKPTRTGDTQERTFLPTFPRLEVTGVETKFDVSAVLKGDKALKEFVLHHYRYDGAAPNGPMFVAFEAGKGHSFLLFLVREPDGRYAPAIGQTDPAYQCVQRLAAAAASPDILERPAGRRGPQRNAAVRPAINVTRFARGPVGLEREPGGLPREIRVALQKG